MGHHLYDLVARKKNSNLEYISYSGKHSWNENHLRSYKVFRSNGLAYSKHAETRSYRACTCVFPEIGINVVCGVLPSWPQKNPFSILSVETGYFCEAYTWDTKIGLGDNRAQLYKNMLALQEAVGSPAVSCRCRWNRADLNYASNFPYIWFSEKSLAPEHVILCAHLFRFGASSNRSTAALDAAKHDIFA
jgi:hypothetical protein